MDVQISSGAAGGAPSLPGPGELVARFQEGGLAALVQSPAQREIMERVQVAMAVVEGHAEHVMDALAPELVPHHEGLRDAMERRRDDRSAPQRILMRLLGMDMKMRQYRRGQGVLRRRRRRGRDRPAEPCLGVARGPPHRRRAQPPGALDRPYRGLAPL